VQLAALWRRRGGAFVSGFKQAVPTEEWFEIPSRYVTTVPAKQSALRNCHDAVPSVDSAS
jgi:hypothetical protein